MSEVATATETSVDSAVHEMVLLVDRHGLNVSAYALAYVSHGIWMKYLNACVSRSGARHDRDGNSDAIYIALLAILGLRGADSLGHFPKFEGPNA